MLRFRFLGFPIFIQPWFWLIAAYISGAAHLRDANGLVTVLFCMAVVFISILGHELGHALTIRRFGYESFIQLHGMGGVCTTPSRATTRWQNILISSAGPAVGFLLAILFALLVAFAFEPLVRLSQPLAVAVLLGLRVNLLWSFFNLLPVLPMDGGHIFRDIMGPRRLRATFIVGGITAILCAVVAIVFQYYFAAALLVYMAVQNFRGLPPPGGVETAPLPRA